MKDLTRYGLTLGIICFLASSVLAVVNAVTEPRIQIQKEKTENSALKEVMPDSSDFKPESKDGKLIYYKCYDSTGRLNGFVVKSEGKGYSSTIEVLAGLTLNLDIKNVKILSQNETPGLGTRVTEIDFLKQFKNKNPDSLASVDSITGATISSRALINSLKDKIFGLKETLLGETKNAE